MTAHRVDSAECVYYRGDRYGVYWGSCPACVAPVTSFETRGSREFDLLGALVLAAAIFFSRRR